MSYLARNFQDAGLFDRTPRVGDIFITAGEEHTGMVWSVNDDNSIISIEGNWQNRVMSQKWRLSELDGFCHPPYSGVEPDFDATTRVLINDLHAAMSEEKVMALRQPRLERLEQAIVRMAESREGH